MIYTNSKSRPFFQSNFGGHHQAFQLVLVMEVDHKAHRLIFVSSFSSLLLITSDYMKQDIYMGR
jgi:hypothetical protein